MIKKLFSIIILFLVVVLTIFVISVVINGFPVAWNNLFEVKINGVTIAVEIANTPTSQVKGLSGRESLAENEGMLFIFSEPKIQSFWMKDMNFPLDIIWIANEKIIGIIYGAEPESGKSLTIYKSPEPVDKVLEINAGMASRLGLNIGDEVKTQ